MRRLSSIQVQYESQNIVFPNQSCLKRVRAVSRWRSEEFELVVRDGVASKDNSQDKKDREEGRGEWMGRSRTGEWYSLSLYALVPWLHTVRNAQFLQELVHGLRIT